MTKLKLLTLVGTRPELIKLSATIAEADRYFEHILVHSGQNFDDSLNGVFFRDLKIRPPNYVLDIAGGNAAGAIARVIERLDPILEREKPDACLVLGDTNSCFGMLAAKKRQIPIFHMEAGNRCFDQRVPEEINRRLIDHLADINMTYSDQAQTNLLAEGLPSDRVLKLGSPMGEVLHRHRESILAASVLERLHLTPKRFFVASIHRAENVDSQANLSALVSSLNAIVATYNYPIIVSLHPRTRSRLVEIGPQAQVHPFIQFHEPFGFFDYIKLQTEAACVLSDSGTLTEEAAILGFPAIMLRESHERPEGMDNAVCLRSDLETSRLMPTLEMALAQADQRPEVPLAYQSHDVASRIVRTIMSYTDYVNRSVWSK
ncbi:MAG: UDP-N-acetylglucosamine 2-epimerase (non-hydrolyzing) [Alphaproteobacteria bacterium PA3]|nr:MAG: UDP-N-acetylglucosamine 2-epimerase (non-hydrolyzing) [Alphaproteobacteria bacterium PA3]